MALARGSFGRERRGYDSGGVTARDAGSGIGDLSEWWEEKRERGEGERLLCQKLPDTFLSPKGEKVSGWRESVVFARSGAGHCRWRK